MKCKICGESKIFKLHNFRFIKLFKCLRCKTVFAGKNYHPLRTSDWGTEAEEITGYYEAQFEKKDKEYLLLLKKFKVKPPGYILDIGCGEGSFLANARKLGWKVQGIEPSLSLVSYAWKKFRLRLIPDVFKPKYFTSHKFTVISMFDVIEHTDNPLTFIKQLKPLFKKNGYFLITVPNFSSFSIQLGILAYYLSAGLIKTMVRMITQAEYNYHHTYYFTPATVSFLLTSLGFEIVNLQSLTTVLSGQIVNRIEFKSYSGFIKLLYSTAITTVQFLERIFNRRDTLLVLARLP